MTRDDKVKMVEGLLDELCSQRDNVVSAEISASQVDRGWDVVSRLQDTFLACRERTVASLMKMIEGE